VGKIQHKFTKVDGGTLYEVETVLGSNVPVIGGIINYFIQNKKFPPKAIKEWVRHQVEEVGSLVHYLPEIYRKQKDLY
jgi:hypothetical protein